MLKTSTSDPSDRIKINSDAKYPCLPRTNKASPPPLHLTSSYLDLFRYANSTDRIAISIALLAAIVNGAIVPMFSILFGRLLNVIGDPGSDLSAEINKVVLYLVYIGLAGLLGGWAEISLFLWTGSRQASRVRCAFLNSFLHRSIPWFDTLPTKGEVLLMCGIHDDASHYQGAISERLGAFVRNVSTTVAGLIVAFYQGWDLALVILAAIPFLMGVGAAMNMFAGSLAMKVAKANESASSVAQEAIINIKTLVAYGLEEHALQKYEEKLDDFALVRQGMLSGVTMGVTSAVFSFAYAIAVWYGSTRVAKGAYSPGEVINVIFAAVMGGFALGMAIPHLQQFKKGISAATRLYAVIDEHPCPVEDEGNSAAQHNTSEFMIIKQGSITFNEVFFAYPSAPEKIVLNDFNLHIPGGAHYGLVGPSGCGKSTIVQLLMGFYKPHHGSLLIDGCDMQSYDLERLRSAIAVVSQEPTLFSMSIADNISVGLKNASQSDIEAAAKAANAHEFIMGLPLGYGTLLGERGSQLSGGQKQRIAIARCILRNPKILLLDESTSALDSASEHIVQLALLDVFEKERRTTITIAHRLATLTRCDCIVVVDKGSVIEQGTHDELLHLKNGMYSAMVSKQEETLKAPTALSKSKSLVSRRASRGGGGTSQRSDSVASKAPKSYSERLLALSMSQWPYFLGGVLSSACLGLQQPAFALALSGIVQALYSPTTDAILAGGEKWALIYVGIGVGCALSGTVQGWCLGVMGARLTHKIRMLYLSAVLRQEMAWFEKKQNNSSLLVTTLAVDAAVVKGAVGDTLGVFVQNSATVVGAYTIAFIASWKMTLVMTATIPLLIGAQYVQTSLWTDTFRDKNGNDDIEDAIAAASEAVSSIKTVQAFSLETSLVQRFEDSLSKAQKQSNHTAHFSGIAYGLAQFILYSSIGLAFYYGGTLVVAGSLDLEGLLRALCALLFATYAVAQANIQFPEIHHAKAAASQVFRVIDRRPLIDPSSFGACVFPIIIKGDIEFDSVTYSYPSRKNHLALNAFSLTIPAGSCCAFTGSSGSGKSTIISMLERFYQPDNGSIYIDGVDIQHIPLKCLRSSMSLVSQEPILFNGTLFENVKYGTQKEVSMEHILAALASADALTFVQNLPHGLDTVVGTGGVSLSGGQKQRIAIARALVRDSKILLLDESTSALDVESEASVQKALMALQTDRTSIVVAHRLTTIRHADCIVVLDRGHIVELGTHEELIDIPGGQYAKLVHTAVAAL